MAEKKKEWVISQDAYEAQLAGRVKDQDETALGELITLYTPLIRRIAGMYAYGLSDKDDLLQEGLIALYKAANTYQGDVGVSFRSYAMLLVTRAMISALRRDRKPTVRERQIHLIEMSTQEMAERLPHGDESQADPETLVILNETAAFLRSVIKDRLSEYEIKVLRLYLDGYTYKQIAAMLSSAAKSVDNAVFRIKKKLMAIRRNY